MKISRQNILFILEILSICLGALNKTLVPFAMIFSAIIAIEIGNKMEKRPVDTCIGIIYLLCFQNLAIGICAHLSGNVDSTLKYLTQIPFLVIALLWINLLLKKEKNVDKWFILYFCAIVFSLLIGRGNIQSILVNIRNMTVFYMSFWIGKNLLDDREKINQFYYRFENIGIFMLIAGIILLVGGYKLYSMIGMDEVYIAKGYKSMLGRINPRFSTDIFSYSFTRMGSLYYEPVNLSYLFASQFLMALYYRVNNKKNYIYICSSTLGLILSFGKGGILIAFSAVFVIEIIKFTKIVSRKISNKNIIKFSLIVVIIGIIIFLKAYMSSVGGTVLPHFWGMIGTWKSCIAKPIGHGLGTGGNMAQTFNSTSRDNWLSSGGESGFMTFLYQLGFQGMILFCICFGRTAPDWKKIKSDKFLKVCAVLPYLLLIISLLQENTFTPQCIVPFMIIIGASNNISESEEKNHEKYNINNSTCV